MRSNDAFLLYFADLVNNKAYYLPIQAYFIEKESAYATLEQKKDGGMMLHIPIANVVTKDDSALVELAKSTYAFRKNRVHKERNED